MNSLRRRLEKIENAANPRETSAPEWALRNVRAELEFQRILNEMKTKYCCGEPTPLLTQDELFQKARELAARYGSEEAYKQAFTKYQNSPECRQQITGMKLKYGLR
ncbi:MAG: hypothetical protein A4E66_00850 [Syntrophus sp. PtaB.Bin001]|nr:MAG: hypothetical protein A4E66_00850 [Syntrophus sp. PtaB.Bin001]